MIDYLIENEAKLVVNVDRLSDARSQWARFAADCLITCDQELFDEFWGVRSASGNGRSVASKWTSEIRALTWRRFLARWLQVPSDYESTLCLLGVPLKYVPSVRYMNVELTSDS